MHKVYLLLGSNIGDRNKNIEIAISELKNCGIIISKMSSPYNTKPWGYTEQPDFLNQAIECLTNLEPLELLKNIKKIEKKNGKNIYY